MAPTSGWYPDPAGSADLRYWDGQTWTRQTSALPAASTPLSAGPGVLAPPPIPRQPMAPAPEAYVGARAMPGALAGRTPERPTFGHPRARSRSFYGLLAGGVAVVVGAAFAIPPLMSSGHKHASTQVLPQQPPASSRPLPQRSTTNPSTSRFHLPEEFAGYPRITDGRAAQTETGVMKDWPVSGAHVFGIYGSRAGEPKAMAILQTMSLTPSGDAGLLKGVKEGFGSGIPGLTWQDADTGDYGGAMQCGTTTQGTGAAICVFADATTFGFTLVLGDPYDGEPAAVQLRNESEAIPPTPQPDAPQTDPEPDPQSDPASGSTGGRTA